MVRVVYDDRIEELEGPRRTLSTKRSKTATVDLNSCPFAADRQLEDQLYQMKLNKNPRLNEMTKMDKPRSLAISSKAGASRAVAIKAKVLNKIVRDASGVHTYALIPPPVDQTDPSELVDTDPTTNPYVKPYAKESVSKPIMCSFGHRPRSANRVFNPSTMKFRLKHGEVIKLDNPGAVSFGLPAAILKKVLKAPKLTRPSETHLNLDSMEDETIVTSPSLENREIEARDDIYNLFGLPEDMKEGENGTIGNEKSMTTWISNIEESESLANTDKKKRHKKQKKSNSKKLEPLSHIIEGRPSWNESSQCDKEFLRQLYSTKESGLMALELPPVKDRLTRFQQKALAGGESVLFCSDRQNTDREALRGELKPPSVPAPVKGQKLYYDPLNGRLQDVIKRYEEESTQKELYWRKKKFKDAWKTVPKVEYYPEAELKRMTASSTSPSSSSPMFNEVDPTDSHHHVMLDQADERQTGSRLDFTGDNDLEFELYHE